MNVKTKKGVLGSNLDFKYSGVTSKNMDIVNQIIYNEPFSIVSVFKDYLLQDDVTEFLEGLHEMEQGKRKFRKAIDFYSDLDWGKLKPAYYHLKVRKIMNQNLKRQVKQAREN